MEPNRDLNISTRAAKFVNNIVDALDARRQVRISRIWEGKLWFTDDIREVVIRRDVAYRKAICDDTVQNWQQNKIERNTIVKLIKVRKKEFYESMINKNKENPTNMWKTLKELREELK